MELSQYQVDQLFDFVRSKNVRYIDVQYEIVDHLASSIEIAMQNNPSLTFEQALRQAYSKFPVTGFSHWVAHQEKLLWRYWNKTLISAFLQYLFTPKNFLVAVCMTLSTLYIISQIPYALLWLAMVTIVYHVATYGGRKKMLSNVLPKGSNSLFVSSFRSITNIIGPVYWGLTLYFLFPIVNIEVLVMNTAHDPSAPRVVLNALVAILLVLQLYWDHAVIHHFPKIITKEITKKYPFLLSLP